MSPDISDIIIHFIVDLIDLITLYTDLGDATNTAPLPYNVHYKYYSHQTCAWKKWKRTKCVGMDSDARLTQIPEIGSILMGIPFLNLSDVASDGHLIHMLRTLHHNNNNNNSK